MGRLIYLLWVPVLVAGLIACSDEENGGADTATATLADEMTLLGVPPGNWRVNSGGNSVCIRTFTAPGNVTATESVGMSGFGTFELVISESEALSLRGTTDELAARWIGDCVEYDATIDPVFHLENCGDLDQGCPPFDRVRLCGNDGAPTFFARVPDCGQNEFSAVAQ